MKRMSDFGGEEEGVCLCGLRPGRSLEAYLVRGGGKYRSSES